ncbi:MAG: hypothetical protein RM049_37650 [Nostoc sp. DedQUE04]|uniref:hypothetical protein n=1 Tax=Nostoc sp. DedQUE04 TaxID=3075390 RepID=UPI002AD43297|nr:hypothetical protein [Nostoc sp. DedQUE04]MDZ8140953.1 hypothetical protein [Nostoc sp. DedQUE04]
MVQEKQSDRQQRLDNFLQAVEAAQKVQDDIMKYGLEAAHLYSTLCNGLVQ